MHDTPSPESQCPIFCTYEAVMDNGIELFKCVHCGRTWKFKEGIKGCITCEFCVNDRGLRCGLSPYENGNNIKVVTEDFICDNYGREKVAVFVPLKNKE